MMNNIYKWLGLFFALSVTAPSMAASKSGQNYVQINNQSVEIEIISDNGDAFSVYPATRRHFKNEYRAYVEAINGENYSLKIRNHSNQRLGLVIAVDGRNIISGKQSNLKHHETMYIVGPYETQTYSGWRTSSKDIHRFFFTEMEDSYAHAFGDDSAMGVIAVAVFEEKQPFFSWHEKKRTSKPSAQRAPNHSNDSAKSESVLQDQVESEAGTGFGDHETSYVRKVTFNAKRKPTMKSFYKYEWREVLCNKKIIHCGHKHPIKKNRFWPHEYYEVGYAPYPPGYSE